MKRYSCVLLFLLLSAYHMQAQESKPDSLIRKIFATLQAKDEKAFLALCPNSTQLVCIMKKLADGVIEDIKSGLPKDLSRSSMASLDKSLESVRSSLKKTYSPKAIQKLRNSFGEKFRSIIRDGEKWGVDWNATIFTKYILDSTKDDFLYGQNLFKSSSYQSMSGKFCFKDKDSTSQVLFSNLLYSEEEKKWYAGMLEATAPPGMEIRSVVMKSVQVDLPPPPPPKLKKRKITSTKKKRPPKS